MLLYFETILMIVITAFIGIYGLVSLFQYLDDKIYHPEKLIDFFVSVFLLFLLSIF